MNPPMLSVPECPAGAPGRILPIAGSSCIIQLFWYKNQQATRFFYAILPAPQGRAKNVRHLRNQKIQLLKPEHGNGRRAPPGQRLGGRRAVGIDVHRAEPPAEIVRRPRPGAAGAQPGLGHQGSIPQAVDYPVPGQGAGAGKRQVEAILPQQQPPVTRPCRPAG